MTPGIRVGTMTIRGPHHPQDVVCTLGRFCRLMHPAFMDKRDAVELLLQHGGDPRQKSDTGDEPKMIAPSAELRALLAEWDEAPERTEKLQAERAARIDSGQWRPPTPCRHWRPRWQYRRTQPGSPHLQG